MIFILLLAAALAAPPCPHPHRSTSARRAFRMLHSCPAGPDKGSRLRCTGYVVDHVCPLECCGRDTPSNMRWQSMRAAKAKDRWEGNCARSCRRKP